jgi:5'-methylthioadenosine phosphorylase
MEVACLCTVDNYANGLGDETLTYDHILACAEQNRDRTGSMVERIIARFA